jgi:predicted GNAT family acetyltransferase
MDIVVTDVPAERRYEARDGETLAGLAAYLLTPRPSVNGTNVIIFTHTEVEDDYEGKGVGSQIARAALDDARARGLRVHPMCPFIKGWIERHPDYADLVHHIPPPPENIPPPPESIGPPTG